MNYNKEAKSLTFNRGSEVSYVTSLLKERASGYVNLMFVVSVLSGSASKTLETSSPDS